MFKYHNNNLTLSNSTFANSFHKKNYSYNKKSYKPKLSFNSNAIISLKNKIDIKNLRPKFSWITCFEPEGHLKKFHRKIIENLKLTQLKRNVQLGGFSFKDKTLLDRFTEKKYKKKIFDPIKDLRVKNSIFLTETIVDKFENLNISKNYNFSKFDILIVRHVLEHAKDIKKFVHKLMSFINNEGYLILEVPDCYRSLKYGDPSMIWEEHRYYFTYESFINFCNSLGYRLIFKYSYKDSLDDSVVCCLQKKDTNTKYKSILKNGISLYDYYLSLKKNYQVTINILNKFNKIGKIAIYGASHLTFSFINLYKLQKYFIFIIDDNKNKLKYVSPVKLSIVPLNKNNLNKIKFCFLGVNPNHHNYLRKKISKFNKDIKVYSIFPSTKNFYGDL